MEEKDGIIWVTEEEFVEMREDSVKYGFVECMGMKKPIRMSERGVVGYRGGKPIKIIGLSG